MSTEEVITSPALASEPEENPIPVATGNPAETLATNEAVTSPGEDQAEAPTLIMPLEPHPEAATLQTAQTQAEQLPVAPALYTLDPYAASQPTYAPGTPLPPGYAPGTPLPLGYMPETPLPPGYAPGTPLPPGFYPQMSLPPQARAPRKPLPWKKILPLAAAILIVLVGGSFGIWYLVTPHPALSIVSSTQKTAVLPASVSIQVVFLLDGQTFSALGSVTSDATGSVSQSVTLDSSWVVGSHTLTAKDARGYVTQHSYPLAIVQQGDAGTPGPNNSPANDSSFSLSLTESIAGQSYLKRLNVTGHPDPAGGTVCGPLDDGHSHSYSGTTSDGTNYTVKLTQKCSGTYTYGHLTYTETMVSEQIIFPGLGTCTALTPYVAEKINGSYVSGGTFKGTVHEGAYSMNCAGSIVSEPAANGTVTSA